MAALGEVAIVRLGLPPLHQTDYFIVGSRQSKRTLGELYDVPQGRIAVLPYPIDLELFSLSEERAEESDKSLRVCWLGRIIPRKRLDLFLDGAALAIRAVLTFDHHHRGDWIYSGIRKVD